MRLHFIAIGGAVMHNLALALAQKGYVVSGSDDEIREPSRSRLAAQGILPQQEGWFPEKISAQLDAVILGMHARADNPELLAAQALGLSIYSFPEYLYEQTKDKTRVVIGGSHGKTSVTSMIMHVLKTLGRKFDYMVGSQIEGFDTMVGLSHDAPVAIFEGDEYLTSPIDRRPKFHLYLPHIAVLTGIKWDHMNVFPTFDIYKEQFSIFLDKLPANGKLFYAQADTDLQDVVQSYRGPAHTQPYAALPSRLHQDQLLVQWQGQETPLHIFGQHNLQNLHAALLVCRELGVADAEFFAAAASFRGAARRLEKIYDAPQRTAFWDFAHAPSKLKATIEAVRQRYPTRRLVACMELHTFSSLNKDFLHQYAETMLPADEAIVFFEKHTLELKRLPDISPQEVADAFAQPNLQVVQHPESLKKLLRQMDWHNAVLLLMTSGSFGGWNVKAEIGDVMG